VPDLRRLIYTAEPYAEAAVQCFPTCAFMVYFVPMNKSDLNAIKEIVDSALGTHLASVHEEITDLRNELKQEVNELKRDLSRVETTLTARIDHVDEKLGNFENREIDKRLQLEVRVERLEKQRS
jgi:tRNA U34 5-carboxymethylaminomethyl modifying GTPase MnmE/TrmE